MAKKPDLLQTIIIEHVEPELDAGRYPIKREVGDRLDVSADIFKEGHDLIGAVLLYKAVDESTWNEAPMHHVDNDRWAGSVVLTRNIRYLYTIGAYVRGFETWREELKKKHGVLPDLTSELLEGEKQVRMMYERASDPDRSALETWLAQWTNTQDQEHKIAIALDDQWLPLVHRNEERWVWTVYDRVLEVVVDRIRARYGAWYELFPRSQSPDPNRSGTLADCEARLPYVRDMGFDVLYFPPIHPIGKTNRKGRNNSLQALPTDPGSVYAIGNEHGGFDAIDPSLGTLEDFDRLVKAVNAHGMELALDFAINASPDHPYVKTHPTWFKHRPDGTIKYAENPPKKYEDIYALDFYSPDWPDIWEEMKRIILFWVSHGVKIFRVDNPHTKPVRFWEWLIREVQDLHPDVIFLSEAFTRPKMMRVLAKAGFSQSYTYFTWRNFKHELTEYLIELTQSEMREYFRPNFFTNTPDILPEILQVGGRPAFKLRVVLAGTLSPSYGIYSSYELCEHRAIPGTEEYLNSEKYEIKHWDWDRPGNIRDYITRLNKIRNDNPALHELTNLRFHRADNDHILFYGKSTEDFTNNLLIAVNLDPFEAHDALLHIPIEDYGIREDETYQLHELLTDTRHLVTGRTYHMQLDPQEEPAAIFLVRRWTRREHDFDYFL